MSDNEHEEEHHGAYVENAKKEIEDWEKEGPGVLAKVGNFIAWPVQKAAEVLVPESVNEAIASAIQASLVGLSGASDFTVNREAILKKVKERRGTGNDFRSRLKGADEQAVSCLKWNVRYGAAEGGATGAFGLVALAADIPALFVICLREIQQIALCYGYDVTKPEEQEYMFHILRTGSTGDLRMKVEFLVMLKQIEQILLKVTWKKMSADLAAKQISKLSLLAAVRQFAKTLGIQITKRKAGQAVPVVGAVVGASFNATFVHDIGKAAYMCYRRRWIAEQEGNSQP